MFALVNNLWMEKIDFVYNGDTCICSDVCLRWILYLIIENFSSGVIIMSNYHVSALQPEEEDISEKNSFCGVNEVYWSGFFLVIIELCDHFSWNIEEKYRFDFWNVRNFYTNRVKMIKFLCKFIKSFTYSSKN